MSIETALVYIYAIHPAKRFIGCGALIEGPAIVTCRHVWDAAVRLAGREDIEVEIEYPYARQARRATLLDPCDEADGSRPDAVLLTANDIPGQTMSLQTAHDPQFVYGAGYAVTGILGREKARPNHITVIQVRGTVSNIRTPDGRHEFTGADRANFWFAHRSSGSPVFHDGGIHLAGIVSLSETGERPGEAAVHEAFIVPATTIRQHLIRARAKPVAAEAHIPLSQLQSLLADIGAADVPISDIPTRLQAYIDSLRERGATPVGKSNDGADIDAAIGAARAKLQTLDTAGALSLLANKIDEEETERLRRMVPLLEEQAAIQLLSFDYAGAKDTLQRLLALDPDRVWRWIDLGDLWTTTGNLAEALSAFQTARRAATGSGDDRDLAVSHNRIGDVLLAQGDRVGALAAYRAGMEIRARVVAADPTAPRQRDLSVSHGKIGDVLVTQGDTANALAAYRTAMEIRTRLAAADPANPQRQRDLSICHERIGNMLVAQGDRSGALAAYRTAMEIRTRLAAADPANPRWQRDLSICHNKIGDVLVAQGDRADALAAYRAAMEIRARLATTDPANTELQRDLSVSHDRIGNVLMAQGDSADALTAYRAAMEIRARLAAADRGNAEWQRDLSVSHEKIGDVLLAQGDRTGALAAFRAGMDARARLTAADPANAQWQRDLSVSHNKIGDVLLAQDDLSGALASYRADLGIAERLVQLDPGNAQWQHDLFASLRRGTTLLLQSNQREHARDMAQRLDAQARLLAERFPQDPERDDYLRWAADLLARACGPIASSP